MLFLSELLSHALINITSKIISTSCRIFCQWGYCSTCLAHGHSNCQKKISHNRAVAHKVNLGSFSILISIQIGSVYTFSTMFRFGRRWPLFIFHAIAGISLVSLAFLVKPKGRTKNLKIMTSHKKTDKGR